MPSNQRNVFMRDDTLLGVCEALGQDFGFNPFYLRVTLGVLMIWYPVMVIVAYLAAGSIVLLSRLVFPNRRRGAAQAGASGPATVKLAAEQPREAVETVESDGLAVAA